MNLLELFNLEEKLGAEKLDEKLDIFRNYQQYFYLGLTIIIALQLIFSLILPNIQEFSELSKRLTQFSGILNVRKKQTKNTENIIKEEERLNLLLSSKETIFYTKKEIEKFGISILPKIADKFKLTIKDISFSKEENLSKGLTKHPITISGSSNFNDLMEFIYNIEQSQKIINIKELRLNRKSINPVILTSKITLELISLEEKNEKNP